MNFKHWFADRLRTLREAEGMTQHEFAEISEIGIATVERLERGLNSPNVDTCLRIVQVLGIPLSALFEGYE